MCFWGAIELACFVFFCFFCLASACREGLPQSAAWHVLATAQVWIRPKGCYMICIVPWLQAETGRLQTSIPSGMWSVQTEQTYSQKALKKVSMHFFWGWFLLPAIEKKTYIWLAVPQLRSWQLLSAKLNCDVPSGAVYSFRVIWRRKT